MTIHKLVSEDHPTFNQVLEPFNFEKPPVEPVEFAEMLIKNMRHYNGMGLAANQLGFPYRVFAIEADPAYVCYNPKIILHSEETNTLVEGCLTYNQLWIKIKRPDHIRCRFQDPYGTTVTKVLGGYKARCFMHELDHLNGINYTMVADRFHLDQARRKQKAIHRKAKPL